MTFIMSYLTDNGISMASDSNKTLKSNLEVIEDKPYRKTKFFEKQAIGVSVWGELTINRIDFWAWFETEMNKYYKNNGTHPEFAECLAQKLNETITEENKNLQLKKELGIHLTFFHKTEEFFRPSIFHITNKRVNGDITYFVGQPDKFPLPINTAFYLINGGYEPFSSAYDKYVEFSQEIRNFVKEKARKNKKLLSKNANNRYQLLTKECESIIATIRLYQAFLEMSRIKRFIGGPINAICFTEKGLVKEYNKITF